jgi:hypothetical protein
MGSMLSAKLAVFAHLYAIRIVLLVLDSVVVPLLAFGASKRDLYPHLITSLSAKRPMPGLNRQKSELCVPTL